MTYYGTRLSDNISRREPENYLLCLNVPVARTGPQDYLPEEVGLPSGTGDPITVYRPEEELLKITNMKGVVSPCRKMPEKPLFPI